MFPVGGRVRSMSAHRPVKGDRAQLRDGRKRPPADATVRSAGALAETPAAKAGRPRCAPQTDEFPTGPAARGTAAPVDMAGKRPSFGLFGDEEEVFGVQVLETAFQHIAVESGGRGQDEALVRPSRFPAQRLEVPQAADLDERRSHGGRDRSPRRPCDAAPPGSAGEGPHPPRRWPPPVPRPVFGIAGDQL